MTNPATWVRGRPWLRRQLRGAGTEAKVVKPSGESLSDSRTGDATASTHKLADEGMTVEIGISHSAVLRALLVVIVFLTVLNIIVQTWYVLTSGDLIGFRRIFDVMGEGNLPSWYSSVTILMAASILGVITLASASRKDDYTIYWAVLALLFVGLSIDESVSLHERAISPIRSLINANGFIFYPWVIPASIFTSIFLIAYSRFFLNLPDRSRRLFLLAGGIFVGAALGIEFIDGMVASHYGAIESSEAILVSAFEEPLEMIGIAIFIYALLSHLRDELELRHIVLFPTKS